MQSIYHLTPEVAGSNPSQDTTNGKAASSKKSYSRKPFVSSSGFWNVSVLSVLELLHFSQRPAAIVTSALERSARDILFTCF